MILGFNLFDMLVFWSKQIKNLVILIALFFFTNSCKTNNKDTNLERQTITTSAEALLELESGNKRFLENHPLHPDQTMKIIKNLKKGQHPFVTVVTCSDSRVPPELIFDQGLGDIFVIRNAGNIISDYELGSIEYAVEHLKTPLILVLGHTQCGAVHAFIEHKNDSIPNHIQKIVDYIKSETEQLEIKDSDSNYYEEAVQQNVFHGVHSIKNSEPYLINAIKNKEVEVKGAIFNIVTGKVELL